MINVVFFGQLRELLGVPELHFEEFEQGTVADLRSSLQELYDSQSEYLASGKALVAVNQTLVDEHSEVNSGDEVAFFPPVTGG